MKVTLSKQRGTMPLSGRARLMRILQEAQDLAGLGEEEGVLHIVITEPVTMAELNESFLGHEGRTDVLTFDLRSEEPMPGDEPEMDNCRAEVYVCPDVAVEYSAKFGTTPSRELVLYMVHGMLHLAGEDDIEEEDRLSMRAAETRVMDALSARHDLEGFI